MSQQTQTNEQATGIPPLPDGFLGIMYPTTYEIESMQTRVRHGFPLPYEPMPVEWWLGQISGVMLQHGVSWPIAKAQGKESSA